MDRVVAAAVRGEQADLGGAVEQGDAGLAGQAAHFGQAPLCVRIAHHPQRIHVHKALEEVQQGQLLALVLGEGAGEAVAERRAQALAAAFAGFVARRRPRRRAAWPRRRRSRLSLLRPSRRAWPTTTVRVSGLPSVKGSSGRQSSTSASGGRGSRPGRAPAARAPASASAAATTRRGQVAQPGALVAARGQQELGLRLARRRAGIGQLSLLGRAPGRAAARRGSRSPARHCPRSTAPGSGCMICKARPRRCASLSASQWMSFCSSSGPKTRPERVQHARQRLVAARTR